MSRVEVVSMEESSSEPVVPAEASEAQRQPAMNEQAAAWYVASTRSGEEPSQGLRLAGIVDEAGAEAGTATAIAAVVRTRAKLRAAWMERLWSEGESSPDQGLAITAAEVKRVLAEPEVETAEYECFLEEAEPRSLLAAVEAADAALRRDPFFSALAAVFGLSEAESQMLCLLFAVEMDPRLERVLAYLADDTRATRPTVATAEALFGGTGGTRSRMQGLLQWRLAIPAGGERGWGPKTAWQLDEAVLLSIRAGKWVEPLLDAPDRPVRFAEAAEARKLPVLYPKTLEEMLQQMPKSFTADHAVYEVALLGPEGSGRETLAAQFAARCGATGLVSVKAAAIAGRTNAAQASNVVDALVVAVRLARATGAMLFWREAEGLGEGDWERLRALARVSLRGSQIAPKTATHSYVLKPPATARRLEIWAHYSEAAAPEKVKTQRLTPAEIRLLAEAGNAGAGNKLPRRPLRAEGELLQALPCPYTWNDLVVPAQLRATLESFESQVRLRWEVYEYWGFQRLTHLGQGISALFAGPSGTGKTMAAQVLARSLDLELYRVDLAGVVNKYIGETEKRLRDVFEACEGSGALLFFDEADALFGSRTQVKDAHDRFANIEVDYLLQRIEQFDGIAVLATNRKNDLDAAFLRRLRFVVDFLPPGKEERLRLWENALPLTAPNGEVIRGAVDLPLLANEMELNGAQIKAVALGAAFFARQQGTRIGMAEVVRSAQREYVKHGMRLRPPLAPALAGGAA